jgi:glycine/D-amino acid oxidase-like deaminating enzyme
VGLEIPIQPQRGQILATLAAPPLLPLPLDYDAGGSPLYWRQTPRGNVVMGGGRSWDRMGIGSYDRANTPDTLRFFTSRIATLTPAVRGLTVVRTWDGTMGFTPDYRPVIGASSAVPGFVMAHACNGSGLPWSPIVGRLVAEVVTGTTLSLPLDFVSPDRFLSVAARR